MGLERRQAIDNTQVIDFINATIATISWFGEKLVRIEYTARVNFLGKRGRALCPSRSQVARRSSSTTIRSSVK